jgi:hypothetical protein
MDRMDEQMGNFNREMESPQGKQNGNSKIGKKEEEKFTRES